MPLVKRLARLILNLATGVSLLLLAVSVALRVRSGRVGDVVFFTGFVEHALLHWGERTFSEIRKDDEFRDADEGYHRGDGDPESYREAFRRGFVVGYSEAYRSGDRNEDGYRGWGGWRR